VRLRLHRVGEIAERVPHHLDHVGFGLTGHHAHVDLEVDAVRDHVRLGPAVDDRRGERRMRARVPRARHREGQLHQRVAELIGVEQCVSELWLEVEPFDESPERGVDLGDRLVLGEAPHDLRRLDHRVVGAERL
jgi:hypothetical protein